jgi:hypothetical protein
MRRRLQTLRARAYLFIFRALRTTYDYDFCKGI